MCRNRLDAESISVALAQHRNVSCAYDVMLSFFRFCFAKSRINYCSTTFSRNLQCLSLLSSVSGILSGYYMIESYYNWNLWFLLWCLSLFVPLYWCIFIVFWSYTGVWQFMNVFGFYRVRKWLNKTVQSINSCLLHCHLANAPVSEKQPRRI